MLEGGFLRNELVQSAKQIVGQGAFDCESFFRESVRLPACCSTSLIGLHVVLHSNLLPIFRFHVEVGSATGGCEADLDLEDW